MQIAEVTRRLAKAPRDARLHLRRGELYRRHGEWDRAIRDLTRAHALSPDLITVSFVRAHTLREAGRHREALTAIDVYLVRHPDHGTALLERARDLHALRRHAEAADAYTRAFARLATIRPGFYLAQARALVAAGRSADAVRALDKGIARLGSALPLRVYALELELEQKRYAAALARLDRLLAKARRKEKWLVRRGEVLLAAGRPQKARADFARALAAIDALPARHRNAPVMKKLRTTAEQGLRKSRGN